MNIWIKVLLLFDGDNVKINEKNLSTFNAFILCNKDLTKFKRNLNNGLSGC